MNSVDERLLADQSRAVIARGSHRGVPAYADIYYSIRGSILRGDSPPGERIPTEQALARKYRVSVGTIRKTQQMLVDDGLLIKQQGRGTFVSPDIAGHRRVLWVCGIDVLDGDVSPFYTGFLDACHRHGVDAGLKVEPAWVSHHRRSDAQPYIGPDAESRYAAYIFVGCAWGHHPLLQHVVGRELPHIHVDHWECHPRGVLIDLQQGIRLASERLRSEGCEKISVVGFDQHLRRLQPLLTTLEMNLLPTPADERMSRVERNGSAVLEAFRPETDREGLLFIDDILARGGTRTLLSRSRLDHSAVRVAVMSSRQDVIPLGMPVIHVVHDAERVARAAVDLIVAQTRGEHSPHGVRVPFEVAPDDRATHFESQPRIPCLHFQ